MGGGNAELTRAYQVGDRFSGVEAELLRYGAILRVLRSA